MSRPRKTPRKRPFHSSRSTRQRERNAAILATVGLQFEKEGAGFFLLQAIVKGDEEGSFLIGTQTGVSV